MLKYKNGVQLPNIQCSNHRESGNFRKYHTYRYNNLLLSTCVKLKNELEQRNRF